MAVPVGRSRDACHGGMVDESPLDFVTGRIIERYGNPSRTAYLYVFRLNPDADLTPLIPETGSIQAAWVDEGAGLVQTPPMEAIARCSAARDFKSARPANAHERRQLMARVVAFTVEQQAPDQIKVELFSRALTFTPKGDRRVTETWRPAQGSWYSAPIGRE